jgi:hypothetical protein
MNSALSDHFLIFPPVHFQTGFVVCALMVEVLTRPNASCAQSREGLSSQPVLVVGVMFFAHSGFLSVFLMKATILLTLGAWTKPDLSSNAPYVQILVPVSSARTDDALQQFIQFVRFSVDLALRIEL